MTITSIVQKTAITLALLTTLGILVHDTKFEKVVSLFIAVPAALASLSGAIPKLASEGHNHVERVSLANAVRDLHNGTPKIQPRNDAKKFHLQKKVSKGAHSFDGYYVPIGTC
jgi:hypothetical protein